MSTDFNTEAGIFKGHIQDAPEIHPDTHYWLFSELRAAQQANHGVPINSLPVMKPAVEVGQEYTERLIALGDSAILG